MEDKYWVRHSSFAGFRGPLTVEDLRRAIVAGSMPPRAEVRKAVAGGQAEALDDTGWSLVHALLGLPEVHPDLPPVNLPSLAISPREVRTELRPRSAYTGTRLLLGVAAVGGMLWSMGPLASALSEGRVRAESFFSGAIASLICVVVSLALWRVGLALLDIADCHLIRTADWATRRARP